jgi:hypothetical protein
MNAIVRLSVFVLQLGPKPPLRLASSSLGRFVLKPGLALTAPARTKSTNDAAFGVGSVRASEVDTTRSDGYKVSVGAGAPTKANAQSVGGAAAVRTSVALRQRRSVRRVSPQSTELKPVGVECIL